MLLDFVWNVFKTTGSIDSYVLMKEIEVNCKAEKTEVINVIQEENINLIR
ncbi:MAG TPA: YqzL family protein [Ruminiclostridium sp.]